ncbi:hypothetical protein NDU88_004183 [Pleurodeles waltl]|uniref:Uncharacterized protein n=1 Tax=Pleurodeles waltl TaxID=8319 RepID=A0AAV7MSR4_PLEWA|nr:hypothetical protein NDU88_004183 [Pleurodeles waltl]
MKVSCGGEQSVELLKADHVECCTVVWGSIECSGQETACRRVSSTSSSDSVDWRLSRTSSGALERFHGNARTPRESPAPDFRVSALKQTKDCAEREEEFPGETQLPRTEGRRRQEEDAEAGGEEKTANQNLDEPRKQDTDNSSSRQDPPGSAESEDEVFRIVGWRLFLQWDRKNKNTGAHKKVSGFVGLWYCLVGERAGVEKEDGVFMGEQV